MTEMPVIVLAAGASRRMRGADKLLEDVDGEPLLRRLVRIGAVVGPVHAALPPPPHPRHAALDGLAVNKVVVPDAAEGMNASLRRAIAALPEKTPAVMLVLGDLPDLTETDLKTVADAVDLKSENLIWRGTTETGKPGHPVVFRRQLFAQVLAMTGDGGAWPVVAANRERTILVALPGNHARTDLDTPEDWQNWRKARERP
ncbi:MAG: NTP transferase domain-containing protein [Jhaorihella sp.]